MLLLVVVVSLCTACGKPKTPLQRAVSTSNSEHVLSVLDAGAGVDVNTVSGFFCHLPLPCWVHLTSKSRRDDPLRLVVARKLIDAGADLEGELSNGNTALVEAVGHRDLEMVRLLAEAGASEMKWDEFGRPVLMVATVEDTALLKLLLDRGADPNVRVLEEKSEDPHPDRRFGIFRLGRAVTPLMAIARSWAHPEFVRRARLLIEHGADPHATNPEGQTALFLAIERGHVQMTEFLLDAGLDPNRQDHENLTPLGVAAKQGDGKAVSSLLVRGAKVDAADVHGLTPLMFVAQEKIPPPTPRSRRDGEDLAARQAATEALLAAGADPSTRSDAGQVPLVSAASNGYVGVVRALLAAGADPNARDNAGSTPLIAAASGDHVGGTIEIYTETRRRRAAPIQRDYAEVMRLLLSAGADPDARGDAGMTPLLIVSSKGHSGLVRPLLEGGADPHHRSPKNKTAFELASERGHWQTYMLMRCWEGTQARERWGASGRICRVLLD